HDRPGAVDPFAVRRGSRGCRRLSSSKEEGGVIKECSAKGVRTAAIVPLFSFWSRGIQSSSSIGRSAQPFVGDCLHAAHDGTSGVQGATVDDSLRIGVLEKNYGS